MQEGGLQYWMISADRRGSDILRRIEAVPAVREDHDSASRLARGDDKGLKSGAVFAVKKEKIITVLFQAEAETPGKRDGIVDRNSGFQHEGDRGFVRALGRRRSENVCDELRVVPNRRVERRCCGGARVTVNFDRSAG